MISDSTAIIELHYLPTIAYLTAWVYFDRMIIESKENYTKQTYRNRTRILTANNQENLIVPVEKGNRNIPIQEIRIDYKQDWVNKHWRSIQSAYGNAPFFEYYHEKLKNILFKKPRFLFDLNITILEYMFDILKLEKEISFSEKFIKKYPNGIVDLRSLIHPKKTLDAVVFYKPVEYIQVFGKHFDENLCAMDLVFNEGPNALNKIKISLKAT